MSALVGGLILSKMWGWFIAPKFGLPQLGVVDAVGLSTCVRFMLSSIHLAPAWAELKAKHSDVDSGTFDLVKTVLTGAVAYPLALLFAYVWQSFL